MHDAGEESVAPSNQFVLIMCLALCSDVLITSYAHYYGKKLAWNENSMMEAVA